MVTNLSSLVSIYLLRNLFTVGELFNQSFKWDSVNAGKWHHCEIKELAKKGHHHVTMCDGWFPWLAH